eukprot:gene2340-8636_t
MPQFLMDGSLLKKRHDSKSTIVGSKYQKRFFLLTSETLSYASSAKDMKGGGGKVQVFPLSELIGLKRSDALRLSLKFPHRILRLKADCELTAEYWNQAIEVAVEALREELNEAAVEKQQQQQRQQYQRQNSLPTQPALINKTAVTNKKIYSNVPTLDIEDSSSDDETYERQQMAARQNARLAHRHQDMPHHISNQLPFPSSDQHTRNNHDGRLQLHGNKQHPAQDSHKPPMKATNSLDQRNSNTKVAAFTDERLVLESLVPHQLSGKGPAGGSGMLRSSSLLPMSSEGNERLHIGAPAAAVGGQSLNGRASISAGSAKLMDRSSAGSVQAASIGGSSGVNLLAPPPKPARAIIGCVQAASVGGSSSVSLLAPPPAPASEEGSHHVLEADFDSSSHLMMTNIIRNTYSSDSNHAYSGVQAASIGGSSGVSLLAPPPASARAIIGCVQAASIGGSSGVSLLAPPPAPASEEGSQHWLEEDFDSSDDDNGNDDGEQKAPPAPPPQHSPHEQAPGKTEQDKLRPASQTRPSVPTSRKAGKPPLELHSGMDQTQQKRSPKSAVEAASKGASKPPLPKPTFGPSPAEEISHLSSGYCLQGFLKVPFCLSQHYVLNSPCINQAQQKRSPSSAVGANSKGASKPPLPEPATSNKVKTHTLASPDAGRAQPKPATPNKTHTLASPDAGRNQPKPATSNKEKTHNLASPDAGRTQKGNKSDVAGLHGAAAGAGEGLYGAGNPSLGITADANFAEEDWDDEESRLAGAGAGEGLYGAGNPSLGITTDANFAEEDWDDEE